MISLDKTYKTRDGRQVHVYSSVMCSARSRAEADELAAPNRIACIQVTFHEGEGLER